MRVTIFLNCSQVEMLRNGIVLHDMSCMHAANGHNFTIVDIYNSFYRMLSTDTFGGEYPNVVELELMPEDVRCVIGSSIIASNVSWKYIVSILHFKECFYEEVVTNSPCYKYVNEVVNKTTYHICYSKDIVFRATQKYDWNYYHSDKVVKSEDMNIIVTYTQSHVLKAFLDWWCNKLVGYELSMCKNMCDTDLIDILPEKVDLSVIHQFNIMSVSICNRLGYTVFPTDTTEEQRCKM